MISPPTARMFDGRVVPVHEVAGIGRARRPTRVDRVLAAAEQLRSDARSKSVEVDVEVAAQDVVEDPLGPRRCVRHALAREPLVQLDRLCRRSPAEQHPSPGSGLAGKLLLHRQPGTDEDVARRRVALGAKQLASPRRRPPTTLASRCIACRRRRSPATRRTHPRPCARGAGTACPRGQAARSASAVTLRSHISGDGEIRERVRVARRCVPQRVEVPRMTSIASGPVTGPCPGTIVCGLELGEPRRGSPAIARCRRRPTQGWPLATTRSAVKTIRSSASHRNASLSVWPPP